MCGINGTAGYLEPGLIQRMNVAMRHRGPDGMGIYEDVGARLALGHVRLSILDLSNAAAQPMHSRCGRYVLVFNGEIYNFRELRRELARDYTFRSTGDTEVLLRGLEVQGEEFIKRLNGIFAFACWDALERELIVVRDQLGIKPLYLTELPRGGIAFASEIKSLLQIPDVPREPDFVALQQHFAFCHASEDRTALAAVRRLPAGQILKWSPTKGMRQYPYWKLEFGTDTTSHKDAVDRLVTEIETATKRQMVADVPVGAFLSGGLDSSLLTTIAARENSDLQCFTVSVDASDNRLDQVSPDIPYARKLAQLLGLTLHEIKMTSSVADMWPKMIYHLDEPIVDPAVFSCYRICEAARDMGIKVLLSGQGADELFGGYPRYWLMNVWNRLNVIPSAARQLIARGGALLPGSWSGAAGANLRRVRRVLTAANLSPNRRFLEYSAGTPQAEISAILSPGFRDAVGSKSATDECLDKMNSSRWPAPDCYYERDLKTYLCNHNLLYTDKMSMAVGVEARVPLLDMELVNLAVRYPDAWKVAAGKTKRILREAAAEIVPPEIIKRKKAGFGGPYRGWLRNDLAEMWQDFSSPSMVNRRGWFDADALRSARERSDSGKVDLYQLQWAVLSMELWAQQYIDDAASQQPRIAA